jgi:hypothetical protein
MVEEALSLITGRSGGAAVGIACQRANPLILAAAYPHAALAQLVEHIIRNDGVTGSSPVSGTISETGGKLPILSIPIEES